MDQTDISIYCLKEKHDIYKLFGNKQSCLYIHVVIYVTPV